MTIEYEAIKNKALRNAAEFMCVAARTAPKTKGQDNLVITLLDQDEKQAVISKMREISSRDSRPGCSRDADNIKNAEEIIIIAAKSAAMGLNCGFCGYDSCRELTETKGVCAYNSIDLGIALGSAVSLAANFHIDNRLMFSIGKAVIESGIMGPCVAQAIGIPLSASGKNIFFDRA